MDPVYSELADRTMLKINLLTLTCQPLFCDPLKTVFKKRIKTVGVFYIENLRN